MLARISLEMEEVLRICEKHLNALGMKVEPDSAIVGYIGSDAYAEKISFAVEFEDEDEEF